MHRSEGLTIADVLQVKEEVLAPLEFLTAPHYYRVTGKKRKSVHGFLETDKILSQREFATQLMEEPSSFYYGVMWTGGGRRYRQG